MRTIAIIVQRGGSGKSTLAIHLAATTVAESVALIVDTDRQATVRRWDEWRKGTDPEFIDYGAQTLLAGTLGKAAELGGELAVIDRSTTWHARWRALHT